LSKGIIPKSGHDKKTLNIYRLHAYQDFRKIIEAPLSERSLFKDMTEVKVKQLGTATSEIKINSADTLKQFIQHLDRH
jgi:hypothetical protein